MRLVLTLLLKSIWCSQTTTFNSYWLFVTSNMRSYKIYISFLTAVSWCFDPECPEIKSSPHAEQCCLPSGMVTCWWVPPPAAIESGQKRCSGRFWGVFFLAFGVSEELASSMGCRIRLRAFINLETPNTGWFSSGWNVCFFLTGCDENISTWKSFSQAANLFNSQQRWERSKMFHSLATLVFNSGENNVTCSEYCWLNFWKQIQHHWDVFWWTTRSVFLVYSWWRMWHRRGRKTER